jgi:inhibitor of cysteine peptidase
MKNSYIIAVIGCVLILAIGMTAGCTGTTTPLTGAENPRPSGVVTVGVSTTTTVVTPTPSTASPARTVTTQTPGTTFPTLFVNSTSNGKIVTIPVGSRVLIRLNENPTTGYSWNATASKGLAIITDIYTAPDTTLMGAPGYHEWILSPQTVDTYTFKAVSHRPWEEVTATDETFSMVLLVTKD